MTEEMDRLLKSGASEAEIFASIEAFKEKFADYGKDRRSALEFHLRNVERLLMPTQTTSIAMTALQGGSEAVSDNSNQQAPPPEAPIAEGDALDPKVLFKQLAHKLGVTREQAAALKDSRWVAKDLDDSLKQSLSVLGQLRDRLTKIGEELDSEFYSVRAILTPTQAAKFLVWVANNRACMHMLDELWDRAYSKPAGESEKTVP